MTLEVRSWREGETRCVYGIRGTIRGPATHVPKQWLKYIANVHNKVNLCTFVADTWCELGVKHLLDGQHIVIGGGFKDAQAAVMITSGHCEELVALRP